jgi:hypothetical protein
MDPINFTNSKGTLYFYNGSAFPAVSEMPQELMMKLSLEMIMEGVRRGVSKTEQIKDYKEQLGIIEQALYLHNNPSSPEGMKKIEKVLCRKEDELFAMWASGVCALLLLKAIPDDNDNGVMSWGGGR